MLPAELSCVPAPLSSKRRRVGQEAMAPEGGVLRARRFPGAAGGGDNGLSFLHGREGAPRALTVCAGMHGSKLGRLLGLLPSWGRPVAAAYPSLGTRENRRWYLVLHPCECLRHPRCTRFFFCSCCRLGARAFVCRWPSSTPHVYVGSLPGVLPFVFLAMSLCWSVSLFGFVVQTPPTYLGALQGRVVETRYNGVLYQGFAGTISRFHGLQCCPTVVPIVRRARSTSTFLFFCDRCLTLTRTRSTCPEC